MNSAREVFKAWVLILVFFSIVKGPGSVLAQEKQMVTPERDTLIAVAREMMGSVRYCALITVDHKGHPQARAMDPFPPEEGMVIWLATNPKSRKVREIRNDPRVCLYYSDPGGAGYVTIAGIARLVDDPDEKARRWKEEWQEFYQDREKSYLLIEVTPEKLEIVNYKHDIIGDPDTWRVPSVEFKVTEPKD